MGKWILGFSLGIFSSIHVELWAIKFGLHLLLDKGYLQFMLQTNSLLAKGGHRSGGLVLRVIHYLTSLSQVCND